MSESQFRWAALATYNSEVSRGLVHTPEWKTKMVEEQKAFDEHMDQEARRKGWIIVR